MSNEFCHWLTMIAARNNCVRWARNISFSLLCTTKSCILNNENPNIYSNIKHSYLSCRYCSGLDVLAKKLMMNNPARTSTVILENYYVQIASFYRNPSYKIKKTFMKSGKGVWACSISVKWPQPNEFRAEQSKKSEAARVASWLTLEWLQSQKKIDNNGKPVLADELKTSIYLNIKPELLESIRKLSQKYEEEIKPFCTEYEKQHPDNAHYFEDTEIPSYKNLSENEIEDRNALLSCRFMEIPTRGPLPVDELGEEIVQMIETNRVIVIKGATGSGKSTRVPQLLLDHYIRNHEGAKCNIVITQPRRISAVSLATRVASERNENLGFCVGHHVRFSTHYPPSPGTVMFVSTGILLQRLLLDPMLKDISHVIIDEAHERDLNIDLLLMLMKDLQQKNNEIKIVIMSATINAEFFQQYFNNCPLLSIPGHMYNVHTHYIDDAIMHDNFNKRNYEYDERDIDDNLITDVILWIHRSKSPGAILVFLPGWVDMSSIQKLLQQDEDLVVVIAHSKMKTEQQEQVFEIPPEGKRKVILATNIAESSITIPDVVYVVDSGLVKEMGIFKGVKGLSNVWISKAVANQRQGRAGRVCEGECFRLYSRRKYESFDEYPVPEVLRASLESLVMRIKMYTDDELLHTLCKFPSAPPRKAVTDAIKYLQQISVFDQMENLTALGRRIAMFGLHPLLSVALVYSIFFKCVDPMLFITSNLNGDATIFSIGSKSSDRRTILSESHPTDDNIAAYRIYKSWKETMSNDIEMGKIYINQRAMETFRKVIQLNLNYLFKAHLVSVDDIVKYDNGISDSIMEDMVTPALLAATGRLAINAKPYCINGKVNYFLNTLDGLKVQIANDSVNFKSTRDSSPFLTYHAMNTTEEGFLRIYETAQVSHITTLLFCPVLPNIYQTTVPDEYNLVYPYIDLPILCKKSDLEHLLHLREMIWNSLQFFVTHYDSYVEEPELLFEFKNQLNHVTKSVLCDNYDNPS